MAKHAALGLLALLTLGAPAVFAGGTLVPFSNQPVRFSASRLPIQYQTDLGTLGSLSNADALNFTTSAFQAWQDLPDSAISYQNIGPLPSDITASNVVSFQDDRFSQCASGGRPASYIIFDTDGSITDLLFGAGSSNNILGFAGPGCVLNSAEIVFSRAVLNGKFATSTAFKGAFVHEFGHFSGLDHSLLESFSFLDQANIPTMYSFAIGSQLETPELDDRAWIGSFYPTPNFTNNFGTISGRVLLGNSTTGFDGALVIARLVGGSPQRDAVSVVSGYLNAPFSTSIQGNFTIPGLPPGQYTVEVQPISSTRVTTISFYDSDDGDIPVFPPGAGKEFYNIGESNSDDPNTSTNITVNAGQTVPNINIVLNGNFTAPSNDNFANFLTLTGTNLTTTSSNANATKETGEPNHGDDAGGKSVWWNWTPTSSGSVTIDTIGSNYDTTLGVYTGATVSALTTIASNDDIVNGTDQDSRVTFPAVGGTTYRIGIDGFNGGSGTIILNLNQTVTNPAPTISSFTPTTGPVGTSVTITGTNFTGATAVRFNGVSASFTVSSSTQITTTVPANASTGPLSVVTPGGTATGSAFTVTVPAAVPTISSFTPTSGPVGTSVTITGTNFTGATAVRFNGLNANSFAVNSATQITATVPANASSGAVSVVTPGGTATGSAFTVTVPVALPTISSFFPTVGPPTTRVTVTGTNFTGATSVTINGIPVSFTVNSATQITLTVPSNASSGAIAIVTPSGTASLGGYRLTPYAIRAAGWQLAGSGDFNGDKQSDLIWRNYTTGVNAIWLMNGITFVSSVLVPSVTDLTWQLVGAADMTQDGKPDLLWRNYATGANALWQMDGTNFIVGFLIDTVTDPNWQLIGAADYSGDGQPDLLWRNYTTSQNAIWVMNRTTYNGAADLGPIDLAWQMVAPGTTPSGGSFNGDPKVDILWRNLTTLENAVWYMDRTALIQGVFTTPLNDPTWQMIGSGDFNNDNQPDLIWRNFITGDNAIWLMNGINLNAGFVIGNVSPN